MCTSSRVLHRKTLRQSGGMEKEREEGNWAGGGYTHTHTQNPTQPAGDRKYGVCVCVGGGGGGTHETIYVVVWENTLQGYDSKEAKSQGVSRASSRKG